MVRPKYVIVENVPLLLGRGMGAVVGALANLGYIVEWESLQAIDLDAPHIRDRVFIVASKQEGFPNTNRVNEDMGRSGTSKVRGDGSKAARIFSRLPERIWWPPEPPVGRVVDGLPYRVDRVEAIGRSVVPQVAEHVGRLILEFDKNVIK